MVFDNEQDKEMISLILADHQLAGPYQKVGSVVKVLDALALKVEQASIACTPPAKQVEKEDK